MLLRESRDNISSHFPSNVCGTTSIRVIHTGCIIIIAIYHRYLSDRQLNSIPEPTISRNISSQSRWRAIIVVSKAVRHGIFKIPVFSTPLYFVFIST
jgi:hypothetical protein